MTHQPMQGVKMVEVAQFTFTPAAGAVLADWGADVIKVEHLQTMEGQWAPVQDPLEVGNDPQMAANGYVLPVVDADGKERRLVASPVQFDETAPTLTRGPLFAEHTDDILRELGKSEDEIIQLKIDGAVT